MTTTPGSNLKNIDLWIRLLYMLVFGLLLVVARMVIWAVALLQFVLVLVTGKVNDNLRNLGQSTAKWCFQALLFITFNSEAKPFPFADWPEIDREVEPLDDSDATTSSAVTENEDNQAEDQTRSS